MNNKKDINKIDGSGWAAISRQERVRTLIDAMLNGGLSPQTRSELDQWFASSVSENEKNHVIAEYLYREIIRENLLEKEPDEQTRLRYAKLCAKLGLPQTRTDTASPKKRVIPRRNIWWVAAAVAIPFIVMVGISRFGTDGNTMVDAPEIAAIKVEAVEGVQKDIFLPDSTHVWLNESSIVMFPERWVTDVRNVTLKGQAYFDVRRYEGKPFVVNAGLIDVRVLGTRFDIRAFPDSVTTEVELFEGSVEVLRGEKSLKVLIPGETLVYYRQTGKFTVTSRVVGGEPAADWRSEIVYAKDRTLPQLFRMIGNYYDVEIVYDETDFAGGDVYDSAFGKGYTGENVIRSLSLLSGIFTYSLQDGRIGIEKKNDEILMNRINDTHSL